MKIETLKCRERVRWRVLTAIASLSVAAHATAATDGMLPVVIAKQTFQLPFSTEPAATPTGNPGAHVIVDLSPILAQRKTVFQNTLDLPHHKCVLAVKVTDVTFTEASPGARVRIDADFTICPLRITHNSHVDTTLLPVITDRRRVSFTATDGEASGFVGDVFHGNIKRGIESTVERGFPTFDVESIIPTSLRAVLPAPEILNVRLTGVGSVWRVEATVSLQSPSTP